MRTKRSKQYKKLLQQFQLHHGFREPYQVLVDADLVRDSQRFAMDLQAGLERTLHGKVKIMITQCCIRHLYAEASRDGETAAAASRAVTLAKTFERRRCGHRPEQFPEPLSTLECLSAVVDDKKRGENRHRYVVASQNQGVRRFMRGVSGVPLIYINRSVMIMEPMSETTAQVGAQAERAKFRSELRRITGEKRKREPETEEEEADASEDGASGTGDATEAHKKPSGAKGIPEKLEPKKPKAKYGVKGPNPLSVKKKKKPQQTAAAGAKPANEKSKASDEAAPKKKRKRKHKAKTGDTAGGGGDGENGSGGDGGAAVVAGDAADA